MSEIYKVHEALISKKQTCEELIKDRLRQLEESNLNSSNYILKSYALSKAKTVDAKIASGQEIGLLEGVPFGLKDVYMLQGQPASGSSNFLKTYTAPYTATAIQKLLDAGAIPIVKENCDSFGHGSSTENTVFGPAINAHDLKRVAGGSSGGSAVNVAKGFTTFSIGGDTGGSIRQPAGYNRIYGLKPTFGRVSRFGLMAYASSTDVVGPLAKSLEDIRIIMNVISGKDFRDQTSIESESLPTLASHKPQCIGYYKNFLESEALDVSIKAGFMSMIDALESEGVKIKPLDFFETNQLVSTYYTLAMAETASNLARLDGTNFGKRIEKSSLKETYAHTRSENFTEETKRRIVGGNQVLSQGHSEEIYLKARAVRSLIAQKFSQEFDVLDVVLSPVSLTPPPMIGSTLKDPLSMYLSDAYTVGFSLGGLPTLTAPDFTETGIQITAGLGCENKILSTAQYLKELV